MARDENLEHPMIRRAQLLGREDDEGESQERERYECAQCGREELLTDDEVFEEWEEMRDARGDYVYICPDCLSKR